MALTFERILSMIKNGGYKLTPQRKCILDIIMKNTEDHLTIEEIFDKVKKNSPEIGIATVYRTIQMLEEIGVVIKHHFDEGTSRYELADSNRKHDHHHLVCLDCGKVIDIQDNYIEELENHIEEDFNFKILNHTVTFYGHCEDCQD